jgi:hypothetical protein
LFFFFLPFSLFFGQRKQDPESGKRVGQYRVKCLGQYRLKQVGQYKVKRLGQHQLKQVGQFKLKWVGQYGVRLSLNVLQNFIFS